MSGSGAGAGGGGWFPCCCAPSGYSGATRPPGGSSGPTEGSSGGPTADPCGDCATGTTPRRFSVEVTGMGASGLCVGTENCAALNGTYVLLQCSQGGDATCCAAVGAGDSPCGWALAVDICVCEDLGFCSEQYTCVTAIITGGVLQVDFHNNLATQFRARFELTLTADNCNVQNETMTFNSGASSTQCPWSSATVKITALN